jgi:N-acyl-L-homoserine lactone synthetase
MHHLRCEVFHRELKWTTGLNVIGEMEFDEYDQPYSHYIVHLNSHGEVDATCRLLPTSMPYMIADHYPEFVENIPLPNTNEIWEISRFCASEAARKQSGGKIVGQLVAAAIEFGLTRGVKNYVALATDNVIPVIKRVAGWDPQPLGPRKKTPDDFAYSVIYTVSTEMLDAVKKKNKISASLLEVSFEIPNFPGETMNSIPQITTIPPQKDNQPNIQREHLETTLSYLEAMAFSLGHETILTGLKLTRLVIQYDKDAPNDQQAAKVLALKTLDETYMALRQHVSGAGYAS